MYDYRRVNGLFWKLKQGSNLRKAARAATADEAAHRLSVSAPVYLFPYVNYVRSLTVRVRAGTDPASF